MLFWNICFVFFYLTAASAEETAEFNFPSESRGDTEDNFYYEDFGMNNGTSDPDTIKQKSDYESVHQDTVDIGQSDTLDNDKLASPAEDAESNTTDTIDQEDLTTKNFDLFSTAEKVSRLSADLKTNENITASVRNASDVSDESGNSTGGEIENQEYTIAANESSGEILESNSSNSTQTNSSSFSSKVDNVTGSLESNQDRKEDDYNQIFAIDDNNTSFVPLENANASLLSVLQPGEKLEKKISSIFSSSEKKKNEIDQLVSCILLLFHMKA